MGLGKKPAMGGMGFALDISKLKGQQDYQDEFMEAAKNFSKSWRDLLQKDKRFLYACKGYKYTNNQ